MSVSFDLPAGRGHPALVTNTPVSNVSKNPEGPILTRYLRELTTRAFEMMAGQAEPSADDTLATLISEQLTAYVSEMRHKHRADYDGWMSEVFPMQEAPSEVIRDRVWDTVPAIMEENPEGVIPQILTHVFEDY